MRYRLIALLLLATVATGCAAGRAFRKGQEASRNGQWDAAVEEYTRAVQEDPDNAMYKITLERAMQTAAQEHISRARELETKDQLDMALMEYRRAVELDATNRSAAAKVIELEKNIRDRIEASRPKPPIEKLREQARAMGQPVIGLKEVLPKLSFNNASLKGILDFIGTSAGINITYESTFRDVPYTINLEDVTVEQALQQIMLANTLFYKVVNQKTIMIIPDNAANRSKYEDIVVRVFYLSHGEAPEVATIVNSMTRITQMPVQPQILPNKTANTITVRATAPVVEIIEKIIRANDKPRAEVVIDVQILEVSRRRVKSFGLNLTDYAVGLTFSPELAPPNTGTTPSNPPVPPPFNLNTISQGISTADFYLSVPAAFVRFLATDSQTKLIAKPQLRGAEGVKLTLNLGDEIPLVQTVFGAPVAGGFASIPQSSFTYRNVGINLEITPRVTYEGDIRLELSVESSSLGPSISVGGQDAPTISTRKVLTTLRLREGESNLLAGLLRDDQRKILTGFPGLIRTPLLRTLFGSTNDTIEQSDIVMLLTPHVVRTHELTAEDLAPIYIGTQQNVSLGGPPPLIAPPPDVSPATTPAVTPPNVGPATTMTPAGAQTPPGAAPPGAQPSNLPPPPGTTPVPTFVSPLPTAPPGTTPPAAATPPGTVAAPGVQPTAPPRDPTQPATPPAAGIAAPTPAQVIVSPPSTDFRVGSGPYSTPISINNASRLTTLTLTITYNAAVLRVRSVQEGTFMRQGGGVASFTPKIDAINGRVDIAVTRTGDAVGAAGSGVIASLLFDAVAPGGSMIQVSGVAAGPDGAPLQVQFSPVTVTVR
jgi:type II secretory pathway component GspD/PulD (secretin)